MGQMDITGQYWELNIKLMVVCWSQWEEIGGASLHKKGALWNEQALSVSKKCYLSEAKMKSTLKKNSFFKVWLNLLFFSLLYVILWDAASERHKSFMVLQEKKKKSLVLNSHNLKCEKFFAWNPKKKRNLYGSQPMMIVNSHSHYVAWSFVWGLFCFILNGEWVKDIACHNCTAFFQES